MHKARIISDPKFPKKSVLILSEEYYEKNVRKVIVSIKKSSSKIVLKIIPIRTLSNSERRRNAKLPAGSTIKLDLDWQDERKINKI